jgi:hypothetical protein
MTGFNRSQFLTRAGAAAGALALGNLPAAQAAEPAPREDAIEVAAYYFPQFHPDRRNDGWHGAGWTEWEIVRRGEPRFPGHEQPNLPTVATVNAWNEWPEGSFLEPGRRHGMAYLAALKEVYGR